MTTTSSLLPSGMEIPAGEDLEMASPYQGQADDFDIDIDLMEDHVSNMDSDMMGADDFPNTSQPSLFQNDTHDADMVDEPSEGSMVDADNLADEDHDIEVQYDDNTYEADMLEGDHVETTDIAVPAINIEGTPSIVTPAIENNEPSQVGPEAATDGQEAHSLPPVAIHGESEQQQQEPTIQAQEIVQETIPADNIENEEVQPLESAETNADNTDNTNNTDNTDNTDNNDNNKVGEQTNEPAENKIPGSQEHHTPDHSVENLEDPKASSPKPEPLTVEPDETCVSNELEHENNHDDESLHTVKVIYQDNEISLFPPLEGDSAETFFLHDEDVAYDNVGRLFSSLREVLLDNIAEHDTLVIDIDSLGIQITEVRYTLTRNIGHRVLIPISGLVLYIQNHFAPDLGYLPSPLS